MAEDTGSLAAATAPRTAASPPTGQRRRDRHHRPHTNGKIERFHRTLADGRAYAHHYPSETARRATLPGWLHAYNHHRAHNAIGGQPPITRLTNLPGHHT